MSVRWPEMIDGQEKNTVFLKPLVTSSKSEVGEFTYYNDPDGSSLFARYTTVGGNPARGLNQRFSAEDIARLQRLAWWNCTTNVITEHVRPVWKGPPAELEQAARDAGLADW